MKVVVCFFVTYFIKEFQCNILRKIVQIQNTSYICMINVVKKYCFIKS